MIQAIILAAGAGTRMKSELPKVMHSLAGKSMLKHVLDAVPKDLADSAVVVVGNKKEAIKSAFEGSAIKFADQDLQLGTGHAVKCAGAFIEPGKHQLILAGDTPLVTEKTLRTFIEAHKASGRVLSVLTARFENPFGYGRIIKSEDGDIIAIVEEKDCSSEQRMIQEINTGMMIVEGAFLMQALEQLKNDNNQGEYYLTDIIGIAHGEGQTGQAVVAEDPTEVLGINSRIQLHEAAQLMNRKKCLELMAEGVTIVDMGTTFIDSDVQIGTDTIIEPFTQLKGLTVIGKNCVIGPGARLTNTIIANGVQVLDSTLVDSQVDDASAIGPYAYLRPKSDIGKHVKIGDFVEVKNARISDYSKVSHLSYIGDGIVGEHVNVGCGVVFVNYDGVNKFKTIIEDHAFVGCNANLIAPVTVGRGAYVAAGSTVTDDVPENSLAIARQRQVNKLDWIKPSK
jgi:bifunctional UDP-N-acetylglucosamine pyrophosphorylase/glucosamine-1-phosphate N-acetyltransferase